MPHPATWIDLDQIKQRIVSIARVQLSTVPLLVGSSSRFTGSDSNASS
jgi:hypothetical protein